MVFPWSNSLGGTWCQDMTRGAYEFCGAAAGDEAVDGDGMTPLFSAIAFEAAETWT